MILPAFCIKAEYNLRKCSDCDYQIALKKAKEAKNVITNYDYFYYAGVANPMSVLVDTFGTGKVDDSILSEAVNKVFDFRPAAIIDTLQLRRPIYRQLAAYGHIGREDLDVVWEHTDKVDALRATAGL